jgi:hypothetical protein
MESFVLEILIRLTLFEPSGDNCNRYHGRYFLNDFPFAKERTYRIPIRPGCKDPDGLTKGVGKIKFPFAGFRKNANVFKKKSVNSPRIDSPGGMVIRYT